MTDATDFMKHRAPNRLEHQEIRGHCTPLPNRDVFLGTERAWAAHVDEPRWPSCHKVRADAAETLC